MSLMQLLAVGRSIKSVRNERSPYKMAQQNLLPKFVSGKEEGAPENLTGPVAAPLMAPRSIPDEPAPARERPETPAREPVRKMGRRAMARLAPVIARVRQWRLLKRNPFVPAGAAAIARPAVQCELSLEKVRPVRNDLNDTDLEVVTAAPSAEAVSRAEDCERPRYPWSRVTARIFGARTS